MSSGRAEERQRQFCPKCTLKPSKRDDQEILQIPSLRSAVLARPRRKKPPELRPYTSENKRDRSVELVSVALEVWEGRINRRP
jgi:hypothetical protein